MTAQSSLITLTLGLSFPFMLGAEGRRALNSCVGRGIGPMVYSMIILQS